VRRCPVETSSSPSGAVVPTEDLGQFNLDCLFPSARHLDPLFTLGLWTASSIPPSSLSNWGFEYCGCQRSAVYASLSRLNALGTCSPTPTLAQCTRWAGSACYLAPLTRSAIYVLRTLRSCSTARFLSCLFEQRSF